MAITACCALLAAGIRMADLGQTPFPMEPIPECEFPERTFSVVDFGADGIRVENVTIERVETEPCAVRNARNVSVDRFSVGEQGPVDNPWLNKGRRR